MNKKLIFKNRLREMRTAKLALILCIALDQKFEDMFYFELSV